MHGRNHTDLRKLVERYESHRYMRTMQMNVLAVVGLIGFGLFALPLFTIHPSTEVRVADVSTMPQKVFPQVSLNARSAIVYDLTNHVPLYERNANDIRPLASLTKLLTVYAAVSKLPDTTQVTITKEDLAPEGDSGLQEGEVYTLDALERFALVASSNDAAQSITQAVAVHEQKTDSDLLASVATALGLLKTRAQNGTGLDISTSESGGYGTAYDIATLAGAIVEKNPDLALATTHASVRIDALNGGAHVLQNTNQFIETIPSPLLSKTGYTDLAGGNLAVVFDAGVGHRIAVVVLGSTREARFSDVRALVQGTLSYLAPSKQAP